MVDQKWFLFFKLSALALCVGVCFIFSLSPSHAQTAGTLRYSAGQMQWYNGSAWSNTIQVNSSEGCSNAGQTRYNSTRHTLQQCNGTLWYDMNDPIKNNLCNNGSWTGSGYCTAEDNCEATVGHGTTRCCINTPQNSYCRARYRLWTCGTDGNWDATSTYATTASGDCTSAGSYTDPDSVRCATDTYPSGPHADGCDPAPTGIMLECAENLDGSCFGSITAGSSCSPPQNCDMLAPALCCSNGPAMCTDSCGTTCFIPGTPVELADGTYKNIEDVVEGDMVLTSNGPQPAHHIFVKEYNGLVYGFNGKEPFFTPNHPFATTEGWKALDPAAAKKETTEQDITLLEVGDEVILRDGSTLLIEEFSSVHYEGMVHNFEVTPSHDFFANGYLVHNADIKFE